MSERQELIKEYVTKEMCYTFDFKNLKGNIFDTNFEIHFLEKDNIVNFGLYCKEISISDLKIFQNIMSKFQYKLADINYLDLSKIIMITFIKNKN